MSLGNWSLNSTRPTVVRTTLLLNFAGRGLGW
jgi:hypothetical protein